MKQAFSGKNVLITAGPTREPLDPIGYISHRNCGNIGYDIAASMLQLGAKVFLVSGPAKVALVHPMLTVVKVNTACEMYLACCKFFEAADVTLFAAAVSDYRPKEVSCKKITDHEETLTIKMVKNIDIAAAFANYKSNNQLTVGFASETNDNIHQAILKMEQKNLDMVVLKSVETDDAFDKANLKNIRILRSDYSIEQLQSKQKSAIVKDIVAAVSEMMSKKQGSLSLHHQQYNSVSSHRPLMA